jgi:hypothetical protein
MSSRYGRGHGGRSSGNKGLRNWRDGYGVLGYTGYLPSAEAAPLPVKSTVTERHPPSAEYGPQLDSQRPVSAPASSTYVDTFKEPGISALATNVSRASVRMGSSGNPGTRRIAFAAETLYKSTIESSIRQDQAPTVVPLHKHINGVPYHHRTTYGSSFGSAATVGPRVEVVSTDSIPNEASSSQPFPSHEAPHHNTPADGSAFFSKSVDYAYILSLALLTPFRFPENRENHHVPLYAGHVPASAANPHAVAQGSGRNLSRHSKDFLLFTLKT